MCQTYVPNLYGDMDDDFNQGLPSDRFNVDWWIASEYVGQRVAGHYVEPDLETMECPVLNRATVSKRNYAVPPDSVDPPLSPFCLVEVPADLATLKREAPDLALQWRLQTRNIFESAFNQGYCAVDFLSREGRNFYLLQKDWQPSESKVG